MKTGGILLFIILALVLSLLQGDCYAITTWSYLPDYLVGMNPPRAAVIVGGGSYYKSLRTDDTGNPVKIPANVPLLFKVYYYDGTMPDGLRLITPVVDVDQWEDPNEYHDIISSDWDFGDGNNAHTESWLGAFASHTYPASSPNPVTVSWSMDDLYKYSYTNIQHPECDDPGLETAHDAIGTIQLLVVDEQTQPDPPVVTDDGEYTNVQDSLHVIWTAEDPESGIGVYWYGVGTTTTDPNVYGWHLVYSNTPVTELTITGLALQNNTKYYILVKAVNGVGLTSGIGASDGITVDTAFRPTVRVKENGDDARDGSTWELAKEHIQSAIDTAAGMGGGKVWVEAGNYNERITVPSNIEIYGGFNGTETLQDQRRPDKQITVIDGGGQGSVVTVSSGATESTIIDGFTVTNGSGTLIDGYTYGGGIYCQGGSPTISHNCITGNFVSDAGGGIYCINGSPSITANKIFSNRAWRKGGGVFAGAGGMPALINNTVAQNRALYGGGVYIGGLGQMVNNTIADNFDCIYGSVFLGSSSPTLSNNIIAFNTCGIYADSSPGFEGNCVYGNPSYNYRGMDDPGETNGNISADPKFVDRANGDYGLSADSPCIDAAVPTLAPSVDRTGRGRPYDGDFDNDPQPDIGQQEYHRFYVDGDALGEPINGITWGTAYRDIQSAVDKALAGEAVWVADDEYQSAVALTPGVMLYGGFTGSESNLSERDPQSAVAIINGGVTISSAVPGAETIIDGFTITGSNTYGGIYSTNARITVSGNRIVGNSVSNYPGAGIRITGGIARIYRNLISQNTNSMTQGFGGGISCEDCDAWIACNVISSNTASAGAGIWCDNSSAIVLNNTLVGNQGTSGSLVAGVITVSGENIATIANNIVASNSTGGIAALTSDEYAPRLRHNNLYNNETDYSPDWLIPDEHSLSADPMFVNTNDYHLQNTSPCIGRGDVTIEPRPELDMDGRPRFVPPIPGKERVDMGAYQCDPAGSAAPVVIDDGLYIPKTIPLHAVWWFSGFESDVAEYWYAIGTKPVDPGEGYIIPWRTPLVITATEDTVTNLTLVEGQTYYWYVKAKSQTGEWSGVGVSDGITVGNPVITITYEDEPDTVTVHNANGTKISTIYDERFRLRQIRHVHPDGTTQTLIKYEELDGVGNRKRITIDGTTTLYDYDKLGRLIDVNRIRAYDYDWVGNRIASGGTSYLFNNADQLTSFGYRSRIPTVIWCG